MTAPMNPDLSGSLPRTRDRAYDLRQRLNRAVQWLREAEDIARLEMPAWPTADRIRSIYEQVTEDVLNGSTAVPPMRQRLAEAEAEFIRRGEALRRLDHLLAAPGGLSPAELQIEGRRIIRAALDDSQPTREENL